MYPTDHLKTQDNSFGFNLGQTQKASVKAKSQQLQTLENQTFELQRNIDFNFDCMRLTTNLRNSN